jgi:adenine phosphoribosyltransferase
MKKLEEYVRTIPDFPEPGIMFRDVTSVLQDADGFALAVDTMLDQVKDLEFDAICGAEARGFLFGAAMAYKLHKPILLARKKGKLPCETVSQTYDLEYGQATIEMHKDTVKPGWKVLLVDDLMATGGTLEAMVKLTEKLGGKPVGVSVLMELKGLKGRAKIEDMGCPVFAAISYDGK